MTEQDKAIKYENEVLPNLDHIQLMDELENAARRNEYGSHTDQLALIRIEILRRIEG